MRVPKLCHHKGRQLGYIKVEGKAIYFRGPWPRSRKTPPSEIEEQYRRALRELVSVQAVPELPTAAANLSIDELWLAYYRYCETRYRKNDKPTSETQCIVDACRVVAQEFGATPAREFGPRRLDKIRERFRLLGWSRDHINKQASRVKRMFRWAVAQELIPESVWIRLRAVEDIRPGDGLREPREIAAVPDPVLWRTIGKCPRSLRKLIWLHRLIGCRADEVCIMRTCDIDQAAAPDLWTYTPASSKNEATYWIGPRAQAILRKLLRLEAPEAWLFPTRDRGRGCWHTSSYRRAVLRASRLAGVERWSPLQVRHAAAQEARDGHPRGIEATQARLQHKEVTVSQVYAKNLEAIAQDVARRFG